MSSLKKEEHEREQEQEQEQDSGYLVTNTYYESKYVFDINENIFNPNKVSGNHFLYKLNRRIQHMETDIHLETEDSFKHRIRLYNMK